MFQTKIEQKIKHTSFMLCTFFDVPKNLLKASINLVMSVCLSFHLPVCARNKSFHTEWIFTKFGIQEFFDNLFRKFNFHLNLIISLSLSNGTTARGGPRPPSRVSSILTGLGRLLSNFFTLA